jgi:Fe-S oxidoreductase
MPCQRTMKVGLFLPCYIDQFYSQVAIAVLQLLEKRQCEVIFPMNQTCCGQPMANSGFFAMGDGDTEIEKIIPTAIHLSVFTPLQGPQIKSLRA